MQFRTVNNTQNAQASPGNSHESKDMYLKSPMATTEKVKRI